MSGLYSDFHSRNLLRIMRVFGAGPAKCSQRAEKNYGAVKHVLCPFSASVSLCILQGLIAAAAPVRRMFVFIFFCSKLRGARTRLETVNQKMHTTGWPESQEGI